MSRRVSLNNAVSFDEKMLYAGGSLRAGGYVGLCSLRLKIGALVLWLHDISKYNL